MPYNAAREKGIEAWRKPQDGAFEVGDTVVPGKRTSYPYYYQTLSRSGIYRITHIERSQSRTRHQLINLEPTDPSFMWPDENLRFDARNFTLHEKGDGSVDTKGTVKKAAAWIIVDASNGNVVGSYPLTDPPAPEVREDNAPLLVGDPVGGTVQFLDRLKPPSPAKADYNAETYTESLVDTKIAELLRKNPEGSYAAFKLIKTGRLPILPVQWV